MSAARGFSGQERISLNAPAAERQRLLEENHERQRTAKNARSCSRWQGQEAHGAVRLQQLEYSSCALRMVATTWASWDQSAMPKLAEAARNFPSACPRISHSDRALREAINRPTRNLYAFPTDSGFNSRHLPSPPRFQATIYSRTRLRGSPPLIHIFQSAMPKLAEATEAGFSMTTSSALRA
jgi:hypothetical protein